MYDEREKERERERERKRERERERDGGVNIVSNRLSGILCEAISKVCGHDPVRYFKFCLMYHLFVGIYQQKLIHASTSKPIPLTK
jgi:hypothetical protein